MKKLGCTFGLVLLVLVGCENAIDTSVCPEPVNDLVHERIELSMDTPVQIRIFDIACSGADNDDPRCELLDEAFTLIFDLETRLTVNDVGGEVERINEMAGISPVEVASDTFYLIERSIYYSLYSEGLFNATIGPVTNLWRIGMEGARRPDDTEISAVLPLLDPTRVVMDAEASTVFLEEAGMRLDLGAIAKGFMADEVAALLTSNGVCRAMITIGGEVLAVGGRYDGTPFRVGIHSPFPELHGRTLVGVVPTYNRAVLSSGTYNRFFVDPETDVVYHHIFDARTGFPFDNDIVGITIIADTGLLGEVYTTIVFALGIEEGLAYVEAHPGIEVVLISQDGGIYLSSGLEGGFELEPSIADDFEIRTP
ncbi:MAG: FAD:protein FMN transferase [Turicibacter sp.]|nr:FAD:protein FMN transferase [Turicibacter sp.]